ncbi:MAG: DNA repair protein RecN [Clostridia bacterium]|nr:DNA repair protein RecN [Clostridia bacterium]
MLLCLNIKNVALIESVSIEFEPKMTVLTGETGAGKSIIIDCVNLLLGARSDKTLVRYGTDKARIQGVFSASDEVLKILEKEGIDQDGDTVLIDRELSQEGRNICRINGVITTQNVLREIGTHLINIHGQQDNQALLTPHRHIDFLDEYAKCDLSAYQKLYEKRKEILLKLENLDKNEQERAERIDLLSYQTDEIASADLKVGEEAELRDKKAVIDNAEKIALNLNNAYDSLYGDNCAYDLVSRADNALSHISGIDKDIDEVLSKITDAKYIIEDSVHEIGGFLDRLDFNENEQNEIEERLDTISRLKKKYGGSEEAVLSYLENAISELDNLKNYEKNTEELQRELSEVEQKMAKEASQITEIRTKAAKSLQKEVENALSELDMPNVKFEIALNRTDFSAKGAETAEFMICPNRGEELKPLAKIASGGELSRTILAIKSVVCDNVDTLIFDEIDTGVSGNASKKIATKLSELAETRQVICVSHSPQVAAKADNHLVISKSTNGDRTVTEVKALSYDERIYEVARIIDGNNVTETAVNHAKEMMAK